MAHARGVTVEGELGCLGSLETMRGDKEDGHGTEATMTRDQLLTDPEQAADFVKKTQLDALAIAIGTSHGAYKFTRKPTGDILAIDRIKEIHRRIPNTHLVMHGSSSVPQDLLAEIRQYGGNMKETYGVPVEEIQEAIKHGVRKINIDTDIRLAMTGAIRKYMAQNPDKFDPRDYLKPRARRRARSAASATCSSAAKGRRQDRGAAARPRSPSATRRASSRRRSCERRPRRPATTRRSSRASSVAAADRARQGARELRGRQRPHAHGRERPAERVRRRHGRADPRQGPRADADGAALVRAPAPHRPNHLTGDDPESVVAADERDQVRGRSMLVKRLKPLPIEAVVRGYLAGSGWKEYQQSGAVCGVMLPPGLNNASKLPAPIFTPATKAEMGDHDENIDFARASDIVGADLATKVRDIAIRLYSEAAAFALDARHRHRRHQVRVRPRRTAR
jgi:hypothetical protein